MSTKYDESIGAVKLDVENGRDGLWSKIKLGFKHVYENHFDDFDWFLKADDDAFVIVENLKEMLSGIPFSNLTACPYSHFGRKRYTIYLDFSLVTHSLLLQYILVEGIFQNMTQRTPTSLGIIQTL